MSSLLVFFLAVVGLALTTMHVLIAMSLCSTSGCLLAIWVLVNVRGMAHQRGTPASGREGEAALVAAVHAARAGGRNGYGNGSATASASAAHHLLRLLATVGHYPADSGGAGCAS